MQDLRKNKCRFSSEDLHNLFDSSLIFEGEKEVCTDSRSIEDGDIFIPLVGVNFDGHNFIGEILKENKNSVSFCEKSKFKEEYGDRVVLVDNTLESYHKMANSYLKKVNPKVVAITGSSGKTTTKELIYSVLSTKFKVHKTEKNNNNEYGVPKTILEMPEDTEVVILELAMRARGEISQLSKICEPDISVINNVGTAHIGRLGSKEEIVRAKLEILDYTKKKGVFIYHHTEGLVSELNKKERSLITKGYTLKDAENVSVENRKTKFTFKKKDYEINALGNIYVLNSMAAILVANELGLEEEKINKGLESFKTPEGRGEIKEISKGKFLIDETYNANPDSVKEAIRNISEGWGDKVDKLVILGEMAELGEHSTDLLTELNTWIESKKDISVITIGDKLRELKIANNVEDKDACCDILKDKITNAKELVILVKGSRVAKMDEIIKRILEWTEKK